MKCDGPGQLPCRGCRQAGQPCIFEARTRPKSISTLPSRNPGYYPSLGRPGSPTPLASGSGSSGFYPSHSQPAPPVTSRAHPPTESYIVRGAGAREPLPPAPPTSLSAMAYAARGHSPSASMSALPTAPSAYAYYNAPVPTHPAVTRPVSPTEARWRNMETSLRSLSSLPSAISAVQSSISHLQRSSDAIYANISTRASSVQPQAPPLSTSTRDTKARDISTEVSEAAWQTYRTVAWPLTPWLVGLRESAGLAGLVVLFLGRRTLMDKNEQSRREWQETGDMVYAEIGRLVSERLDWTREEIRALGVFA